MILLSLSQPTITCLKLTIETLEQDVKYVRSRRGLFWCLHCHFLAYFTPCSRVFMVNFEQVNAVWDRFAIQIPN